MRLFDFHAHPRDGFHIQVFMPRSSHPEWRFRRYFCVFAVWWARKCDAGITLFNRDLVRVTL